MKYVVVSPVKDEEEHIEHTLQSMVRQTARPECWIIVDDGSRDRTPALLERYRAEYPFIHVLTLPRGQVRQPGSAVVRSFQHGYDAVSHLDHELVVKLDGDLRFGPEYFASIIDRLSSNPRIGIASGVYSETVDGTTWRDVLMPPYHAAGASKVIRRQCFREIGGFVPARGWDTIDEIRAMSRGWQTCHFPDLKMHHLKPEGRGIGRMRTHAMHGEIYYLTGGGLPFLLLKVLHRLTARPYVLGAAGLLWGYLQPLTARRARLVTPEEARHYRTLLNHRITGVFARRKLPAALF